jgi:transposase, IS30 family
MRGAAVTEVEKVEIWDRRRSGESMSAIARHLGRGLETIRRYVLVTGGVRPRPRTRSRCELTVGEREEISRGLAAESSCHAIARRIQRAPSSVSREVARNGGRVGYRAAEAEQATLRRGRRPKTSKLAHSPRLRAEVEARLKLDWSPQQISAFLKVEYAQDPQMQISHETIYLSLFVQSRGALRKELARHLRTRRLVRQPKKQLSSGRGQIVDKIMIRERPAEAADRAVPGHWEGDLLVGTRTTAIGTLVERSTRYAMLFALPNGLTAERVREGLTKTVLRLPTSLRRSLTWDQGPEMAEHVHFTIDTGVNVFFCDPRSPWQRGSNENTNGLLRQYFPKGHSLAGVTQDELDRVAHQLNGRPRQTLGWHSPTQKLAEFLEQSSPAGGATTA